MECSVCIFFFFQAEDGIRDWSVTGVQTCALPIFIKHLKCKTSSKSTPLRLRCFIKYTRVLAFEQIESMCVFHFRLQSICTLSSLNENTFWISTSLSVSGSPYYIKST